MKIFLCLGILPYVSFEKFILENYHPYAFKQYLDGVVVGMYEKYDR